MVGRAMREVHTSNDLSITHTPTPPASPSVVVICEYWASVLNGLLVRSLNGNRSNWEQSISIFPSRAHHDFNAAHWAHKMVFMCHWMSNCGASLRSILWKLCVPSSPYLAHMHALEGRGRSVDMYWCFVFIHSQLDTSIVCWNSFQRIYKR